MENEDIINKIDVTYLWGDQEPCFYYACKLAQEAYVNEEYRVFKAPFEEMRLWAQKHFWEDYAEEECLLLLGLSINDIVIEDLESLLSGRRFRNVQLDNVKKIIITAYCDPMEFEFCVQEDWDITELGFAMGRINQEYELRDLERKRFATVFKNLSCAIKKHVDDTIRYQTVHRHVLIHFLFHYDWQRIDSLQSQHSYYSHYQ